MADLPYIPADMTEALGGVGAAAGPLAYASHLPGRRPGISNGTSIPPYATQYQQPPIAIPKQQPVYRPIPPYQTMPDSDTNQFRTTDQQHKQGIPTGQSVYAQTQYSLHVTQQPLPPQPWPGMRPQNITQQPQQQSAGIPRTASHATGPNGIAYPHSPAYAVTAPYATQTDSRVATQTTGQTVAAPRRPAGQLPGSHTYDVTQSGTAEVLQHHTAAAAGSPGYAYRPIAQGPGTVQAGHSTIPTTTQVGSRVAGPRTTSMQQSQATGNCGPQQPVVPVPATHAVAHYGRRASPGQQTGAQDTSSGIRQVDARLQSPSSSISGGYVPSAISKQGTASAPLSADNTSSIPLANRTVPGTARMSPPNTTTNHSVNTGDGNGYRTASPSSTSSYASVRTSPHRPGSGKPLVPSNVQQVARPGAGVNSFQTSPREQPAQYSAAAKPPPMAQQQTTSYSKQTSRQRVTERPPWDFGNEVTELPSNSEVQLLQQTPTQQQGTKRNNAPQSTVPQGPPVPRNLQAVATNNRAAALAALAAARNQNRAGSARNTSQQTPSAPPQRDQANTQPPALQRPPSQRLSNSRERNSAGLQPSTTRTNSLRRQTTPPGRGAGVDDDVRVVIPKASYSVGIPDEEQGSVGPTIQCSTCGRRFVETAYQKHAKICEKVFVKKRKVFNTTEARVAGTEAAKFVNPKTGASKTGLQAPSGRPGSHPKQLSEQAVGGNNKMAKWKAQSEQLRAAMRNNKIIKDAQARGEDITKLAFEATPEELDDRVPCPYCGRKFAPLTAERHIPKCKDTQAKPNFLKAKGGTGAYMRNK